jgi:hypothetical protein
VGRAVWTEGTRAAELLRRVWAFWEGGGHPRFLPWHAVPCCVPHTMWTTLQGTSPPSQLTNTAPCVPPPLS